MFAYLGDIILLSKLVYRFKKKLFTFRFPFSENLLRTFSPVVCFHGTSVIIQSLLDWLSLQLLCLNVLICRDGLCEYIEEYPVKLIHKFSEVTGIDTRNKQVLVVLLQYGEGFHGPEEDVFRVDRAATDPEYAEYSNFLHPVVHYFQEIPKGR